MRYAILGDIHSNLEALTAVVEYSRRINIDRYISVGDIVGYGTDPERCMDVLAALPCDAVAGNHDRAVAGLTDFSFYSEGARAGILWSQERTGKLYKDRLGSLPLTLQTDDCCVVHASWDNPDQWTYILDNRHALPLIRLQTRGVCFYGHTHLPVIFCDDGSTRTLHEGSVELSKSHRYLVNAGSVGQPRDGYPLACLLVFDTATFSLEMHRLEYDVAKTQQKILEEGLPSSLALRLCYGR